MDTYNPHFPLILGQEWVPIRNQNIEFAPLASIERGYQFNLNTLSFEEVHNGVVQIQNPQIVDSTQYPPGFGVNVYRAGAEKLSGPVQVVTLPCSSFTVTGSVDTTTSWGKMVGFTYNAVVPASANFGADFFFDVTPYQSLLEDKRILNVSLLYAGYVADFDPTPIGNSAGRAIPFVYPPGVLNQNNPLTTVYYHRLATPTLTSPPPYISDSAPYGMGSMPDLVFNEVAMFQVDTANPAASPMKIGALSLGSFTRFTDDGVGTFLRPQWSYDDLALLRRGTAAGTAIRVDVCLPATTGASSTLGYPRLSINYMALRIAFCEETRVLTGVFRPRIWSGAADIAGGLAPSLYGAKKVALRDPARDPGTITSTLTPGTYTVTTGYADQGEDGSRFRAGLLAINGTRQLDQVATIPAIELNLPFPATEDTTIGQTFTVAESDIMPQVALITTSGLVKEFMPGSQVYGRQSTAQIYGDFIATQDIIGNVTGVDSDQWPWIRFYARRYGNTTVPLRIRGITPMSGLQPRSAGGASTPSFAAANADLIYIVADVTLENFPQPGDVGVIAAKFLTTGNQRSFRFIVIDTGNIELQWSADGSSNFFVTAASAPPWDQHNGHLTVAVAFSAPDGFVEFYWAEAPDATFNSLGIQTFGATSIFDSTAAVTVGGADSTSGALFRGTIHSMRLYTFTYAAGRRVNFNLLASPDFVAQPPGTLSFADDQGNVWTVLSSGPIADNNGIQDSFASLTASEFDALDELADGWKEVTLELSEPVNLAVTPSTSWEFSATGAVAGDRWEILGAAAPMISGGIPGSFITPVPSSTSLSWVPPYHRTYGGASYNESWAPKLGPYSNFGADPSADVSVTFAQAEPAVEGLQVSLASQPVSGIGEDCGMPPCGIPTHIQYHSLGWYLPANTSYVVDTFDREVVDGWGSPETGLRAGTDLLEMFDDFDRTVVGGWGTATSGQPWDSTGAFTDVAGGFGTLTFPNPFEFERAILDTGNLVADADISITWLTNATMGITGGTASTTFYTRINGTPTSITAAYFCGITIDTSQVMTLSIAAVKTGLGTRTIASMQLPDAHAGNTPFRVRLQTEGHIIRAKCWDASDPEPDWQLEGLVPPTHHVDRGNFSPSAARAAGNLNDDLAFSYTNLTIDITEPAANVSSGPYTVIEGTATDFSVDDGTAYIDTTDDSSLGLDVGQDFDVTTSIGMSSTVFGTAPAVTYLQGRYQDADNNYTLAVRETGTVFNLELRHHLDGTIITLATVPLSRFSGYIDEVNNFAISTEFANPSGALENTLNNQSTLKVRWAAEGATHRVWVWSPNEEQPLLPLINLTEAAGLYLPGAAGSYASTPDASALDITGDIDIRVDVTLPMWPTGTARTLVAKFVTTGDQRSYHFWIDTDSYLHLTTSTDGTSGGAQEYTSSPQIPAIVSGRLAVRVTLDVDNGASGSTARFETGTSINGPWTLLASDTNGGTTSIFSSTAPVEVGSNTNGTANLLEGVVHAIYIANTIGNVAVTNPQFQEQLPGTVTFLDATGKVWTVNGEARIQGAVLDDEHVTLTFGSLSVSGGPPVQSRFSDLVITPPRFSFGAYELQRADDVEPEWKTIMRYTNPGATAFNDFEARPGILSSYRIRAVDAHQFPGPWSDEVEATLPAPGVLGGYCLEGGHILIFTSNERQDGAINLAYSSAWESGNVEEGFSFPEASFVQLQAMFDRDFYVAFRPMERGGEQFTRTVLVQAAAIPPETLADFTSLRDMAWDAVNYICVRDEDGNRWFASVAVPSGRVINSRKLYLAPVNIVEVTDTPTPVDQTWPF